ncbi:hypothetical protein VPNG_01170 [Cytospora leucostoma]|uniref:Pectate lyase n=1 Tax=Cytospora leucostoma TaxID=1230097 RepID=A0A423XLE5_9PEZI|nr:hypothetical protein VPNG_01170 [Cytospora leucostoma]
MSQRLLLLALALLHLLGIALANPRATKLSASEHDDDGKDQAAMGPRADESVDGTLHCGTFATGSKHTAPGLVGDLQPGGKIAGRAWDVRAGTCQRVHCWDTTGVYDASHGLTVRGTDVGDAAHHVWNNCCRTDYTDNKFNDGISGQKFVRNGTANFNVVLGYGDCEHPVRVRPYDEGGQGVNGKCVGGDINPYWEGN